MTPPWCATCGHVIEWHFDNTGQPVGVGNCRFFCLDPKAGCKCPEFVPKRDAIMASRERLRHE